MTKSNQSKTEAKKPAQKGELSETDLNKAAGGFIACAPATQVTVTHAFGDGGGAGKPVLADGSVKPVG
jgi:hypothetical protein